METQRKILVTGGPVHVRIDSVKMVTNGFRGGHMAAMAEALMALGHDVTYLCSESSLRPVCKGSGRVVVHDGFADYQDKVLSLASKMDGIVLGAAVANLIPVCYHGKARERVYLPLAGKFPSHDYFPGEPIIMEWSVAPRVIDMVRNVAPRAALFGFKLLDGAGEGELVRAAQSVMAGSRANMVFANDRRDLNVAIAVTREGGCVSLGRGMLPRWVDDMVRDRHYHTVFEVPRPVLTGEEMGRGQELLDKWKGRFLASPDGMRLSGSVAVRCGQGFLTTEREKLKGLDPVLVHVSWVRHFDLSVVLPAGEGKKATLNAPLFDRVFGLIPEADHIVHLHERHDGIPCMGYAPPGTLRDSMRVVRGSFNVDGHGCCLVFNKEGKQI